MAFSSLSVGVGIGEKEKVTWLSSNRDRDNKKDLPNKASVEKVNKKQSATLDFENLLQMIAIARNVDIIQVSQKNSFLMFWISFYFWTTCSFCY